MGWIWEFHLLLERRDFIVQLSYRPFYSCYYTGFMVLYHSSKK